MERHHWRMAAFFGVILAIIVPFNFYVFDRSTNLLGFADYRLSLIYAVVLVVSMPVVLFSSSYGRAHRFSFMAVTTVFAIQFMALLPLLVFEFINLVIELPKQLSGFTILLFVILLVLVSAVNARIVVVRKIKLDFPAKVRAVQISDIHIGIVHREGYLAKVVDMVNSVKPDIVLITGDITSGAAIPDKETFALLDNLDARTFMAFGNHEYYEDPEEIERLLADTKVEVLRDAKVGMNGYSIFGLDYKPEQGIRGARELVVDSEVPVILLTHLPQMLPLPAGSLILAGHHHAGQVFPINFFGRYFVKYFKGLYEEDDVRLYVSPGTGTWGPPLRFGSRNEITLLELG